MFCSEWSLVKVEFPEITVMPLRCRCWSCDECRPGRTRRLVEEAKTGLPTLFITLTSRWRSDRTPSWAAQELVKCWRNIRRQYVYEHGKGSIPFLCVFEATKRGWPHLHIIARCKWLDQAWLSDQMAKKHNSPIVDVRRVHGLQKVAHYISKYISKNPHRFEGVKRYWRSLDFLLPCLEPEPWKLAAPDGWVIKKTNWREYAEQCVLTGLTAVWERNQVFLYLDKIPPKPEGLIR